MPTRPTPDFRLQHLRQGLGELYEFQALLGRGAFATVYLVRNLRLDRLEAFKVLSEVHDDNELYINRFIQEAKVVAALDHPNIVKVYDFGKVDGILWFSMQYIDGPTLRAELENQGLLAPKTVVRLAIPLLEALGYSHQMGTVHRDIKPSNILLDRRGRPYLMDFGIAKSTTNVFKTATGNVLGTPAYVSPEQIRGEGIDGRADLYSLSAAMYEMLAGLTPFQSADSLRTIVMRLEEDPIPLSVRCPSVPKTLEDVVMRGLERQPEDRYQDAESMREALAELSGGQPDPQQIVLVTSVPKPKPIEDLPSTIPDNPALADLQEAPTIQLRKRSASDESAGKKTPRAAWILGLAVAVLLAGAVTWFFGGPRAVPTASPEAVGPLPTAIPEEGAAESESPVEEPEAPAASGATATEDPIAETEEGLSPGTGSSADSPSPQQEASRLASEDEESPIEARPNPAPPPPPSPPPPTLVRRPVTVPKIVTAVEPALPSAEAGQCIGQSVILSLQIGEDGKVLGSKFLKKGSEDCTEAARLAAEAYVFEPARDAQGQPIAASTTINIRFQEVEE